MPRSTNHITTLIFDWDGTLMDSANLGLHAFQKTFGDLGITFHRAIYETIYSPNWYSMYEALQLPREKWKTADELWLRYYGEEPAQFVEGAEETIQELQRKGYRLGVVSSGTCSRVFRELEELGLQSIVEAVICNEQVLNKKPHPEGLEKAMRLMKTPQQACSYIGDSPEDIEMGKRARVFTVGLRSAYPTSRHLQSANPDLNLRSIQELLLHF